MKNYEIKKNTQFNSIEVYFNSKPEAETLKKLKGLNLRWNHNKKCWYGFKTIEEIENAITGSAQPTTAQKKQNNNIDVSNLDQIIKDCYGSDWSAKLRAEFKKRGADGVTVKSARGGWTDSITVTIKFKNKDFRSIEETIARDNDGESFAHAIYNNNYYINNAGYITYKKYQEMSAKEKEEHKHNYYKNMIESTMKSGEHYGQIKPQAERFPELTAAAFDKLVKIWQIANAANFDKSDIMTDYFDVGYYLTIKIVNSEGNEARETMTEDERKQLKQDQEQERKEQEERIEKAKKEAEESKKAAAEYEKRTARDKEIIYNKCYIKEVQPYFIYNLMEGIGKEATFKELEETNKKHPTKAEKVKIYYDLVFTDGDALERFKNLLLHDFDFLKGKGGTEKDETNGKYYITNAIALYYDDKFIMAIDPEGYSYARYCLISTAETYGQKTNKSAAAYKLYNHIGRDYAMMSAEDSARGFLLQDKQYIKINSYNGKNYAININTLEITEETNQRDEITELLKAYGLNY